MIRFYVTGPPYWVYLTLTLYTVLGNKAVFGLISGFPGCSGCPGRSLVRSKTLSILRLILHNFFTGQFKIIRVIFFGIEVDTGVNFDRGLIQFPVSDCKKK